MGCSIQPDPNLKGNMVEAEAGKGLKYKHAYGLVNVGEITDKTNKTVRLLKLRNPWGMGEWNGKWGDDTQEREDNHDVIVDTFKREEMDRSVFPFSVFPFHFFQPFFFPSPPPIVGFPPFPPIFSGISLLAENVVLLEYPD
jgi:hypothetical protein